MPIQVALADEDAVDGCTVVASPSSVALADEDAVGGGIVWASSIRLESAHGCRFHHTVFDKKITRKRNGPLCSKTLDYCTHVYGLLCSKTLRFLA